MAEQGSVSTNFAAGQTPNKMRGRYDHPLYTNGAEEILNMIPTPGGSLIRRPGTKLLDIIDDSSRLIGFEDQENSGHLLVFEPGGDLFIYTDETQVAQITHNIADGAQIIHGMDYVQVRDYMFFVHRKMAPKMLIKKRSQTHTGDGTNTEFNFDFAVPDTSDITVKKNGVVQTLTTHYTIDTFKQVDGQYIGIEIDFVSAPANNDTIEIIRNWGWFDYPSQDGPWEQENVDPALKVAISDIATDDSSIGDGHYGTCKVRAVARRGKVKSWFNDSWIGRSMRVYSNDGGSPVVEGYANITLDSLDTSEQIFDGTVDEDYPMLSEATLSASAYFPRTKRWALSAWYADQYPEVVGVHQDALWFARDDKRWKTVTGSLFRFSPSLPDEDSIYQVTNDSAISIEGTDPLASKPAFLHADRVLFTGTDTSISHIRGSSAFGAITPSTVSIIKQNQIGAARIKPVSFNDTFFVDALRQSIYSLNYSFNSNSYAGEAVNKFDDELFYKRIRRIAILTQPFPMIWAALDDGTVVNVTINEQDKIFAPSKLEFQNKVLDITVLKKSDGGERVYVIDEIGQLAVLGSFGAYAGATRATLAFETTESGGDYHTYSTTTENEYYTDNATIVAGGTSKDLSTIDSSQVLVESETYENWKYQTSSKTVTPTNDYEVGTPFTTRVKTNIINRIVRGLTDLSEKKKLKKLTFNLTNSLNFKVKEAGSTLTEEVKIRQGLSDLASMESVFTGIKSADIRGDRRTDVQIIITQDESVPLNINSILYEYDI